MAAIANYGIEKDIGYISTGGGAFLEVLGKTLPALSGSWPRAAGLETTAGSGRTRSASTPTRDCPDECPLTAAEGAARYRAGYHRRDARGTGQDLDHADQAAVQPARPVAGLFAGGGLRLPGHREKDPSLAAEYTSRGNLVGVITNGTAVLGLGDIGPLAGKAGDGRQGLPVQKFAGIDVFDIELAERDPTAWSTSSPRWTHAGRHQPRGHQGAGCFTIEKKLRERMNIPVFHDDQHGTAIIISAAALLNGLELVGRTSLHQSRCRAPAPRPSPAWT